MPSTDDAVAHLGEEQLEIQRSAISATNVLYVGLSPRMPKTQSGHHAGQLATDKAVDPIGLSQSIRPSQVRAHTSGSMVGAREWA